jgi:Domain of Unknown Function (DUF1080)
MKHNGSRLILSSLSGLLLCAQCAIAQQTPPQAGQAAPGAGAGRGRGGGGGFSPGTPIDYNDNEGWISLFDGETLNGWDGDTRYWGVKDGAIYVEPSCEKPTGTIYLIWKGGEPGDFMLKFESKGTGTVNGGIQFRSYLTADENVALRYPGRGGGGMMPGQPGRGGMGGGGGRAPGGPGGPGAPGAAGAQAGRGGGGGGRGPQCANPGTPPTQAEKAKWDMAGPQFDFDANNRWPGGYYEQSSTRGTAAQPGTAVLALPGAKRVLLDTFADQATRDSWFHKGDYNQFLLVTKGHTTTMYMNGHLTSVFVDDDPDYFRPSGKLGLEVESTGGYWTKNIFLKRF